MLFAATSRSTPVGITGDEYFQRFLSSVPEYMNALMDKSVVVDDWVLVGRNGSLSIWEVDSHEELRRHLQTDHPVGPHIVWELFPVVPLSEIEVSSDQASS